MFVSGLTDNSIVLGKHSGRHAFRSRLVELGYSLSDDELNRAFAKFKDLADKKKEINDQDLDAIVNDELSEMSQDRYKLLHVQVFSGQGLIPSATVVVLDDVSGQQETVSTTGTGPVDAVFKAIRKSIRTTQPFKLLEYTVSSVTAGIDAIADVFVRVQDEDSKRISIGRSANTDVIVASAQSYVNAVNRLVLSKGEKLPLNPQFNRS